MSENPSETLGPALKHSTSKKLRYSLAIAIPALVASAGVLLQSEYLINRLAEEANASERQLNKGLAQSAIKARLIELGKVALDNGYWDDAVLNTYQTQNMEWMATNFGEPTGNINIPYDTSIVINGETKATIAAFRGGEKIETDLNVSFATGLENLFASMPSDPNVSGYETGIIETPFGTAIAALAPIVGYEPENRLIKGKPNYLLLLSHITQDKVSVLGEQYLLTGLRTVPGESKSEDAVNFQRADKAASFALSWTEKREGDRIAKSLWPVALISFGFLLSVLAGMALTCWNLLSKTLKAEEKAVHDATHDRLTGLPNRKGLENQITAIQAKGQKHLAVSFIDLDGFKDVNDAYGHHFGDSILQIVAGKIRELASQSVASCRLGGDEFLILFAGLDAEVKARVFAESFIESLAEPFDINGRIAAIGASIGIAASEEENIHADELIRRADVAMYRCKALGKNQFSIYRAHLDIERVETREIAKDLKAILAADELGVVFQPVVDAANGKITCVEALARWPRNHSRVLGPDRFIPVAESSGLIDQLGMQILRKACLAAKNWEELPVAVNVSAMQLNNPRFVESVLDILDETKISPTRIEFEITESTLVKNMDNAKRVIERLHKRGIKFALDDFGSGYSGFAYLEKLSFDRVKIDRSVTKRALASADDQSVVQGVVLISRSLKATVTAEGIENAAEASVLRLAGCSELQGYHFYKPMAEEEISRLLKTSSLVVSHVA